MGKNEPERNQDGEDRYGLKRKIKKIVFVVVVDLFFSSCFRCYPWYLWHVLKMFARSSITL